MTSLPKKIHGIPSPCYDGLWYDLKGSAPIRHKFWFCADDLTHCVGRTIRKYYVDRPLVPSTWLVQVRTDLIQFAVTALEEAWFVLCEAHKCAPQTLFVNESTTFRNQLANLEAWPKTHNNKPIQQATMFKLSTQNTYRWEAGWTLEAVILPPIKVSPPRYYIINFGPLPSTKQYEVMIGNFLNCTCVDFIQMMASSLGS